MWINDVMIGSFVDEIRLIKEAGRLADFGNKVQDSLFPEHAPGTPNDRLRKLEAVKAPQGHVGMQVGQHGMQRAGSLADKAKVTLRQAKKPAALLAAGGIAGAGLMHHFSGDRNGQEYYGG